MIVFLKRASAAPQGPPNYYTYTLLQKIIPSRSTMPKETWDEQIAVV